MNDDTMTCEEAIAAIQKAQRVFVYVRTAISQDGAAHHTAEFLIPKDQALSAMKEVRGIGYIPNIVVSENGTKVVIGQHATADNMPSLGHDESNNGNF